MERLIRGLAKADTQIARVAHHEVLTPREGRWRDPAAPLLPPIRNALADLGIPHLYNHQSLALDAIRRGEHVVLATATASGKSLVYQIPLFEQSLNDPSARALCIFPLKALARDQQRSIETLSKALARRAPGVDVSSAIYDGDTPGHRRKKIRDHAPNILITNPDMLHVGILPFHSRWEVFFRNLRYVVIDELHAYRGIFGSHIAQVVRRLRRVARYYGASPQILACSATIDNPAELARDLTGLPFTVIDEDGAPCAERHFLFVDPDGSSAMAAARLFRWSVRMGYRTIVFTKARKITELIHAWTLEEDPALEEKVSSYRSGYLPEERREIEARLKSGDLWGVISTSALEMGIDIGGLDVCILAGYPGSVVNTWQRGGRVGRAGRPSAIILVAQPDALDQYFVRHPENFFGRSFERAVIDPANVEILRQHLVCAADEVPLRIEEDLLGGPVVANTIDALEREGKLLRSATGREWYSRPRRPQAGVDIRGVGERYTIINEGPGTQIGSVSGPRVLAECHAGAIYLHRARQFLVTRLDLENRNVYARQVEVAYYTRPTGREETEILSIERSRTLSGFLVRQGRLKITSQITGYEKRRIFGQNVLSTHKLSLPPTTFETVGIWIEIHDALIQAVEREGAHYMGAIHAMEHAGISLFPLFALCDRGDVGGISYLRHPQVGRSAVFFYDGHPGGVGLCASAFEIVDRLLAATRDLIMSCDCQDGCPSCVHSPRCGSGNRPMDRAGAQHVLDYLLGHRTLADVAPAMPSDPLPQLETRPIPRAIHPPPKRRVMVLDLETRRSAEEVGGWNHASRMGLAVAIIYDCVEDRYERFGEENIAPLLEKLRQADLVVGFNVLRFDYEVIRGCSGDTLDDIPTFDLLTDIYNKLGFRLSLGHLAEQTLGTSKSADGLDSLRWWKAGEHEKVAVYCEKDVAITRQLFEHGAREGHVLFETRDARQVRLPVRWEVEEILENLRVRPDGGSRHR